MINVSRSAGRWGFAYAVLLVGLLLTGCKTESSDSKAGGAPEPVGPQFASINPGSSANGATNAPSSADALDLFRVGDNLTIEFSDIPTVPTPREERIKEDGTVTLLEGKTFVAAGKTRGQLEKEIIAFYVPAYYVKMTVSIRQQKASQFYYVRGEVKAPGRQIYIDRITVLRAIGSAGDFNDFARKTKVQLTRADGRKIFINAKKALKDHTLDLEVFPGDTINVPRRNPFW